MVVIAKGHEVKQRLAARPTYARGGGVSGGRGGCRPAGDFPRRQCGGPRGGHQVRTLARAYLSLAIARAEGAGMWLRALVSPDPGGNNGVVPAVPWLARGDARAS